ncbi:DUF6155 family protein [Oceanobacillus longus]|uniref:DUF6155 family protein n=1 Tax=Oceanobacillus longus TaxID=930120 RepID=A0ABV8GX57_9BACI
MAKVTQLDIPELKSKLKDYDQKELIRLIAELYEQYDDVQHHLSDKLSRNETISELYEETKEEIEGEFHTDNGFGKLRSAKVKKAINNFKKAAKDHKKTLDLMLYYVEIGTTFTNTYGDIDGKFYGDMESMYEKVVTACEKDEDLFNDLQERLYAVVINSENIGWGYHDSIKELYYSIRVGR